MKNTPSPRHVLGLAAVTLGLALSGCATSRNQVATGRVNPPIVGGINAHLELGGNVITGSAKVSTVEVLGLKFSSDGRKRVGTIEMGLDLDGGTSLSALNPLGILGSLFRSPADEEYALSAAYYQAVEESQGDGLVATRAKVDVEGFSVLHIFGWGTASAEITGRDVKITKGAN